MDDFLGVDLAEFVSGVVEEEEGEEEEAAASAPFFAEHFFSQEFWHKV